MPIEIGRNYRVNAWVHLDLALDVSTMWGLLRDWRRTLTIDPLHAKVLFRETHDGKYPPVGADIRIVHRLLGVTITRRGRLLHWREGKGFAVSDLSMRGNGVGFPHVCSYSIAPLLTTGSRLTIRARGRWTATWMPRTLIKLWLGWVLHSTAAHLRTEFASYAAWRRRTRSGGRR